MTDKYTPPLGKSLSMQEVCTRTGLSYETLKYYCRKDLIPGVKRDRHNYRVFDEQAVDWVKGIQCLRRCKLTISQIQYFVQLSLVGSQTIPERRQILAERRRVLEQEMAELRSALDYLNYKDHFYQAQLSEAGE